MLCRALVEQLSKGSELFLLLINQLPNLQRQFLILFQHLFQNVWIDAQILQIIFRGHIRCLKLPINNLLNINPPKKLMFENIICVVFGAQSFRWVTIQQLLNNVSGLLGKLKLILLQIRPEDLHVHYIVKHCICVLIVERWDTGQQLINQDAKCPPINIFIMTLPKQHFRSYILWRAANRIAKISLLG